MPPEDLLRPPLRETRRKTARLYLLFWAVVSAGVTPHAVFAKPPASQAARARALELFQAGNRQFKNGELEAARSSYVEAWALSPSFDIACNLGRTEFELDLFQEAAEHLDYCVANFTASSRPEVREAEAKFNELFQKVRNNVGSFRVLVSPPSAEILVDHRIVGRAPLDREVFVEPGDHQIVARLEGYQTLKRTILVVAGAERELRLELERPHDGLTETATEQPEASAKDTREPASEPGTAGFSAKTPLVITGAVLSAAALGVGIGFTLHAASKGEDKDRLIQQAEDDPGKNQCEFQPSHPTCTQLREAADDETLARNLSVAGYVGAAVLTATTIGLAIWLPGGSKNAGSEAHSRSDLRLELSPRGLSLTHTF